MDYYDFYMQNGLTNVKMGFNENMGWAKQRWMTGFNATTIKSPKPIQLFSNQLGSSSSTWISKTKFIFKDQI